MDPKTEASIFMNDLIHSASKFPISLSTMTVLIMVNKHVSLKLLTEKIDDPIIQNFITDVTGSAQNITLSNSKKTFSNALVFKCCNIPTDHGTLLKKQAVKVFCNGNIHITGVKSTIDAIYLADVFVTLLELVYGGTGLDEMFQITAFDVQMINYCFKINDICIDTVISLTMLQQELNINTPYFSSYNSERHAGVIVKAPMFSFLIFQSGNVIISLQKGFQIVKAYTFIDDFLKAHIRKCIISKPKPPPRATCKKGGKMKKIKMFDYGDYLVLK
jgi:TATA-box binding protein (TBP) (component of TFIID and TFIIIB)